VFASSRGRGTTLEGVAALLGAVVFQLALMSSFTGAEARPVLHHVTIGLVGAASVVPGPAGQLPASAVSCQRISDPASARQAVRDGELPAALLATGDHETIVVAEAAGLTLTAPSRKWRRRRPLPRIPP
jgi:hypothetical protein